jgi:hypothetical protein
VKRWLLRPEVALFALALGAYAYFYQAGGWNQNSRFDLVRATVERGTSSIQGYHRNTGDHARKDGVYYCDKAPGASWLAVPAYGIIHLVAGGERPSPRYLAVSSYLATVWAVGVPAAAAVVALYLLLGALGLGFGARLAFSAAYAFGTLAFPYATLFYGHQLMASLVLIGFSILACARRRMLDGGAPPGPVRLAAAGVAFGFAVVVEYPAALAVLPIFAYACWMLWPGDRKRILWLVAGGAVPGIALAAYHWAVFGGPLTLPYEFSTQTHRGQGFMGIGAPRDGATWGVLFSSYRGLFFSAPWLLLAVPGAALLAWNRRVRPEAIVAIAISLLFFWLNISLVDWQGGWAMGPRYLVPALPFLAVAAAGVALAWPERWIGWPRVAAWLGFAGLAGYSALLMLAGTAVKPEVDVRIQKPYAQFLLERFYAGELAVSTQGIDMKGAPRNAPRRAWNLGHAMGLDGFASLLPLIVFAAGAFAWILLAARRERGPPKRASG